MPLSQAIEQRDWRNNARCYLNTLLGLLAGSQCSWEVAKKHLDNAEELLSSSTQTGILRAFVVYLKGAYCQATGHFDMALSHFKDECLAIKPANQTKSSQLHLAVMAGINRIWIMEHPNHTNYSATNALLTELNPICENHPDVDLFTLWECTLATVTTNPPRARMQRKGDAVRALKMSNSTKNSLTTVISLVIAYELLYVGENNQSNGCLTAANLWSPRSANPLWQSIISGLSAESEEAKNKRDSAQRFWHLGVEQARAAFSWGSA